MFLRQPKLGRKSNKKHTDLITEQHTGRIKNKFQINRLMKQREKLAKIFSVLSKLVSG